MKTTMEARILIVDDHEVVRQGVRAIIQRARPQWEICGEAITAFDAVKAVATHAPNVVVLDISMPGMSGLQATSEIAKLSPGCQILLFSMYKSDNLIAEAQRAGAHGYVQKSQAGRDLVLALERLLAGGTFFGPYDAQSEDKPTQSSRSRQSEDLSEAGNKLPAS
jgi:DNA-binding NarL/FixJ family response regulator